MKLVLGVELVEGSNEATPASLLEANHFITRVITDEMSARRDEAIEALKRGERAADVPGPLKLMRFVSGAIVLIILAALLENCSELSPSEMYDNAPYLFWILLICMAIWGVLRVAGGIRRDHAVRDPATAQARRQAEETADAAYRALGVPADAATMDLLLCRYRVEDGEIRVTKDLGTRTYYNYVFRAWREGDALCFADTTARLDIPMIAYRGARYVREGHYFTQWNKDEAFNSPAYRPYKLATANGNLTARGYIAVSLYWRDEDYELRVPVWEEPTLCALTGWTVEHPPKKGLFS